jgi:hypothetical protein
MTGMLGPFADGFNREVSFDFAGGISGIVWGGVIPVGGTMTVGGGGVCPIIMIGPAWETTGAPPVQSHAGMPPATYSGANEVTV